MAVWPPAGPTVTTKTIPAYLYSQYGDDENLQAMFDAYNSMSQEYLDWFVNTPLGVYTNTNISGSLLDWVAEGLYGIKRPVLPYGKIVSSGRIDTYELDTHELDQGITTGSINLFTTTDDIFKRIITWHFFKGDGQVFTIPWLKRRIMRFLIGYNGVAPNIDNTYPVSVKVGTPPEIIITIAYNDLGPVYLPVAQIFQSAVASGAVELPFQHTWTVNLIPEVGAVAGLAGTATLGVSATVRAAASATLAGGAVLTALQGAHSSLAGTSTLTATATVRVAGRATLAGTGSTIV